LKQCKILEQIEEDAIGRFAHKKFKANAKVLQQIEEHVI
jgi:hypothetical protein